MLIVEGCDEPDAAALPMVTNGMQTLLCKLERNAGVHSKLTQLTIFGRAIPEEYMRVGETTTIVAYFFYPFVVASMFGIAARALMSEPVDLQTWNAHKTNALKTQFAYAASVEAKLDVVDNLLIHQLSVNKRECEIVRYATDHMMSDYSTGSLSEVLKKLDLNERTFQRIFKKYVGITPGQYRRICQFDVSFSQLREKRFNALSDVAYENGFSDQSHFIRSFKEFTATTPQQYLRSGLKDPKQ